jgi:hypothetical protein
MRYAFALLLVACGPSVAVDDGDGDTTSASATTDPTAATVATSASTTATTATTATTMMSTSTATTATDESTSTETTSSDDEGGTDSPFIKEPDGGGCFNVCIECDVWAQDCPEDAKCMAWANDGGDVWNATKCTPLDPEPAAIGDPCVVEGSGVSGIDDCELGAICWGVDPMTNEGTCVPMCTGSEANPMCPDGLECTVAFDAPLIVCLPPCDPLQPTCAADEVCSSLDFFPPDDIRFACQPMPPFEPQPYGIACGGLQICDEGHLCVAAEHVPGCADPNCCTTLCDVTVPTECPDAASGPTCIPLFDRAPPGFGNLGVCGIAA